MDFIIVRKIKNDLKINTLYVGGSFMAQVSVKYNPYRLLTEIKLNGQTVQEDSELYKLTKGKRLQEWVSEFPEKLREAANSMSFSLEFHGTDLDWDDFEDAFQQAEKEGVVKVENMSYVAPKRSVDEVQEKIVEVFKDLQEGPVDAFRTEKLQRVFDDVNNTIFPVNVIATMSSGKSTLINALLCNKLMPSKNEACTATITEILDTDSTDGFSAVAYDAEDRVVKEIPVLTYEEMDALNISEQVSRIEAKGNIPFLDAKNMALELVDTPGPNNAQNQEHRNTTYRAINNSSNNLILYVLNATQMSTNDDADLLQYVSKQIREGGKQMRDRFLFVVNKMDQFNPEEESIEKAVQSARNYLARYGIQDPQLFPCSAFVALNIRTYFKNIDIDKLSRAEERKMPIAARDTLPMIDKLVDYECMHLEKYSTLSPSAQQVLELRLQKAVEQGDIKEQALIHSGICSIEAAITAYVKKYAATRKIKDLVETFENVLESNKILAIVKDTVARNNEAAEACAKRAEAVQQKIAAGKEAAAFKAEIDRLDPMPDIIKKETELAAEVTRASSVFFEDYGDTITSRDEAARLIRQFARVSGDAMAKMTVEIEALIQGKVIDAGNDLMQEYQRRLVRFDEETAGSLTFTTFDLVKGELLKMQETARKIGAQDAVYATVEELGKVTYDEERYWEKVGEEKEKILVGTHEEKIGTQQVRVGSHTEKVGEQRVRNANKRWYKPFTPKYVVQDVYKAIDDYEEQDVFKTVNDYKIVTRDKFEQRVKKIEKFSAERDKIQVELLGALRDSLDEGLNAAINYARTEVDSMKKQFKAQFDKLDQTIKEKYAELAKWSTQEKFSRKELEENQQTLAWLNANMNEINEILNM